MSAGGLVSSSNKTPAIDLMVDLCYNVVMAKHDKSKLEKRARNEAQAERFKTRDRKERKKDRKERVLAMWERAEEEFHKPV